MLTYQTCTYWERTVTALTRVVIVVALLVNIALPFLDHHYAERQPAHDHIYFKGFTTHTHQFKQSQHHHRVSLDSRMSSPLESQALPGLVVLDSGDISYSHAHTLPSPNLSLSSNFSTASYPLLIANYTNTNLTRSGTIIFPPHPPPKL